MKMIQRFGAETTPGSERTRGPLPLPRMQEIQAYVVPRPKTPVDLRLDGNEGAPAQAQDLMYLTQSDPGLIREYPSALDLEMLIAEQWSIGADQVLITAGADEALDRVCRAYLDASRRLILPIPGFAMLRSYARLAGAEIEEVAWTGDHYPVDQVLASAVEGPNSVIAVVSPNNPTGAVIDGETLLRLSKEAPQSLILLDHAYVEYAAQDLSALGLGLPNVLVVRSFSKAWGMAGLRLGYLMGPAHLVKPLRAAGGPYPVSSLSLALGERALRQNRDEVEAHVQQIRRERTDLQHEIREMNLQGQESQANFVFFQSASRDWIRDGMAGLGISVRAFYDREELSDAIRISLPGNRTRFDRLVTALRTVLRPEALLLDMDGVLADVSASYRESIRLCAESFGVCLPPGAVSESKRRPGANNDWILTRDLLREAGLSVELAEVRQRFEEIYQGSGDAEGLWVRETLLVKADWLRALSRRLPLAIVTGRPRADAERFLNTHGIHDIFSTMVCLEDAPLKPDPRPVRLALDRLQVQRAWMVGDTPDDTIAARGAGVLALGIAAPGEQGERTETALLEAGAGRVLQRLEDLEDLLP